MVRWYTPWGYLSTGPRATPTPRRGVPGYRLNPRGPTPAPGLQSTFAENHHAGLTASPYAAMASPMTLYPPCFRIRAHAASRRLRGLYPTLHYGYLLVTNADPAPGLAGVQYGVNYNGSPHPGLDILTWNLCATLEFQSAVRMRFVIESSCSRTYTFRHPIPLAGRGRTSGTRQVESPPDISVGGPMPPCARRVSVALSAVLTFVLVTSVSLPAFARSNNDARLALHLLPHTTKNTCGRADATPACSNIVTNGGLYPTLYYAFLLVTSGDAVGGLAGLQCGVSYDGIAHSGVDIFSWNLCATLDFRSGNWPAAGGGNLITWDSSSRCQRNEPGGSGSGSRSRPSPWAGRARGGRWRP